MQAHQKILELFTRQGIEVRVHKHDAVRTIDDARAKAPTLVKNLIKTIAFKTKDGELILAGVPCHARIDYRKLAAFLGINRRQLRSLSPEEVHEELGFEVGGVCPIPLQENVRAIFDQSFAEAGMIRCGGGQNTRTLELEFSDLLRATHGQLHLITREEDPA